MPRPKSLKPSYCHHQSSGRAFVKIDGRRVYLGPFGSQESRDKYDRVIGEWIARGRQSAPAPAAPGNPGDPPAGRIVTEVIDAFWSHVQGYYAKPADGQPGGEVEHFRGLLKLLRRLYGNTPAAEFGPLKLEVLMGEMVKLGWCRKYVNAQANRLKRMFKWATSKELVPAAIHQALATVAGFRKGKGQARETKKVRPVPEELVDAVKPVVSRQVRAIIELQWITGMRPGEAVIMRGCDIDTSGQVWVYKPAHHKKSHLEDQGGEEHERTIDLGPKAQDVVRPFLKPDVTAFLFSPIDAEAGRREAQAKARNPKTPVTPSQRLRAERAAGRERKRPFQPRYTVGSYRQAISRACRRAFPVPADYQPAEGDTPDQQQAKAAKRAEWRREHLWKPHQLRHAAATRLRKEFGLDVARIILGHTSDTMTAVYAERDRQKAREVMAKVG